MRRSVKEIVTKTKAEEAEESKKETEKKPKRRLQKHNECVSESLKRSSNVRNCQRSNESEESFIKRGVKDLTITDKRSTRIQNKEHNSYHLLDKSTKNGEKKNDETQNNPNKHTFVPNILKKEISCYFDDLKACKISDLCLVDLCDELHWHSIDIQHIKVCPFNNLLRFIFHNYSNKLCRNHNESSIVDNIKDVKSLRNRAAAFITSAEGRVLFVVDKKNDLVLPMGKEAGKDLGNLKLTSLRELGEETNVWLKKDQFMNISRYFDATVFDYTVRIFKVAENVAENTIDIKHSRFGEIRNLKWVSESESKKLKCVPSVKYLKKIGLENKWKRTTNNSQNDDFKVYNKMQLDEEKWVAKKIQLLTKEVYNKKLEQFRGKSKYKT